MKVLYAAACIAVLAMAAIMIKNEIWPKETATAQAATPRRIANCEKTVADATLLDPKAKEPLLKWLAIGLVQCDQYGLLDRTTKANILRGPVAPYFEAFEADPNVWRGAN